ncbi:hypothetical protein LEMLEM_LOCUS648, partial [Lemmus lemmus]
GKHEDIGLGKHFAVSPRRQRAYPQSKTLGPCYRPSKCLLTLEERPKEGTRPCGCRELNSGPWEEQAMFLTTEPSLQAHFPFF